MTAIVNEYYNEKGTLVAQQPVESQATLPKSICLLKVFHQSDAGVQKLLAQ